MLAATAFAILALVSSAIADPAPLTPVASREGENCTISWSADTSGNWTETNIQLMTGDNFSMKHITTIAKVDTSAGPTTYSYPCPLVTPNSAIYFYQFSTPAAPTKLVWSTRFGIADAEGQLTPPQFATQPDGPKSPIPWGNGALENPSLATPPPTYITGQGTVTNGTASLTASSSRSTTSSTQSQSSTTSTSASRTSSAVATTRASVSGASSQFQGSMGLIALGAIAASLFSGL